MWNPEQRYFKVGAHILTVEVEDIYFLTGLLRWGAPISLTGSRGGDITTRELIDRHCVPGIGTSREENPHQGSDRQGSTDCSVHHAEGGKEPGCTSRF